MDQISFARYDNTLTCSERYQLGEVRPIFHRAIRMLLALVAMVAVASDAMANRASQINRLQRLPRVILL